MIDFTLQQLVLRVCALLLIVGAHGGAIAGAAYCLGDRGPRYDGRLRLSPLAHIDLLGFASGVLFSVGWNKPIAIDPSALRIGRIGLVVIVAAATVGLLIFLFALQLLRPVLLPILGDTPSSWVFALIETIGQLGIWFALINLLPVPPLAGHHLLTALVPTARDILRRSYIYAALALTGLAATGIITRALAPVHQAIARLVLVE